MAVHLKKRAYEEFSHVIQENIKPKDKTLKLSKVASVPDIIKFKLAGKPSDRVLILLVRFSKKLPVPLASAHECIKILFKRYSNEDNTDVRVKILWLLESLCLTVGYDFTQTLQDLVVLLNKESSGKVLVQLWNTVISLSEKIDCPEIHQKLISVAYNNLCDTRHKIRCVCLKAIGTFESNKLELNKDVESTSTHKNLHNIVSNYFTDPDPRVRCSALSALILMHHRGQILELSAYDQACKAMCDDYEEVRLIASQLVWIISHIYPENKVPAPYTDEEIRLVDDSFAKICNLMNDSSGKVRTEAAKLLGSMHRVSDSFVFQTLHKKLMSDLKRKKSLNEQAKEGLLDEFSTGKKWGEDVTSRDLNIETTTLMNSGACGAFVHGLEDEMMEVRSTSVDSLTELASQRSNRAFAQAVVDFLVDCLNDEIEAVRLNAVNSIHKIVDQVVIMEDQLDNVHFAMEDACPEIRRGIHELLSSCRLVSKACLYDTVMMLLKNLNKYPQDRVSIWKTQKMLGEHHAELTYLLTSQLLSCHPYFDSSEPQMDDPNYIAVLILVFNAAKTCPQMNQLFPEHVTRHYQYLSDSIPDLVPPGIRMVTFTSGLDVGDIQQPDSDTSSKSKQFLVNVLQRINSLQVQDTTQQKLILKSAIDDLTNISKFAPKFSSTADCMADFLQAQLLLYKSVDQKDWSNFGRTDSRNMLKQVAEQIIELTYKLQYLYIGLSCHEIAHILQLRFKGQVLLFVLEAKERKELRTNGKFSEEPSAKWRNGEDLRKSCEELSFRMQRLYDYIKEHKLLSSCCDSFTKTCFNELLNKLGSIKPSLLVKFFQPLLSNYSVSDVKLNNTVQKARVKILHPVSCNDSLITFRAGLSVPLLFDAIVENIIDPIHNLRIQVTYADSTIQYFLLQTHDIRTISTFKHHITTTIQLCHVKWSDICLVDVALVRVVNEDLGHHNLTEDIESQRCVSERVIVIGDTISLSVQTK